VALVFLIGLVSTPLHAAATGSPSIIVNGDPPLNFEIVTNDSFMFGSDPAGGGDFGFTNDTGQTWTRLDIFVTLPAFEFITCGSAAFGTCTVTTTTQPGASPASYDLIFGPNPNGGIANGEKFTIDLNDMGLTNTDPAGSGQWGAGTDFTALANVPEPAPIALGGVGLLLLVGYRLLFAKRFSKAAN
jgi:hypothetical protein